MKYLSDISLKYPTYNEKRVEAKRQRYEMYKNLRKSGETWNNDIKKKQQDFYQNI